MNLQEFIRLPHRFEWGGTGMPDDQGTYPNDCHTICASWALQLAGIDPAAGYRGSYSDAKGARGVVDRAGGSVALFDAQLTALGFMRVQQPMPGDIAVVRAPEAIELEFSEIGAIRFGPLWACLGKGGMVAKRLDHIAAWRYPA